MPPIANRVLVGLLMLACVVFLPRAAKAAGGPANVLLVVNANSPGSKRVANHYVRLRQIPPTNVLYLDYESSLTSISGDRFREEILLPILKAIDQRKLSAQIDTIAYSTDFPWRIDFTKSFDEEQRFQPINRPIASLTGATYLYGFVLAKSPALVSLRSNFCVPTPPGAKLADNLQSCRSVANTPSRAIRSRYAWKSDGSRAAKIKSGVRYLMATMLGVTQGSGNTTEEVIACLDRSVEADFTRPDGTFWFMKRDRAPRSTPRHACFKGVVEELRKLGADARIGQGTVPKSPTEVAGLMIGAPNPAIDPEKTRLAPGSLVENLTSYGAIFSGPESGYQTPLSDFIRAGAAGASGTVAEPYPVQAKFPLPTLHLHYRRGCSLAESFYQSVAAPYQLLIVGDPLCQPWADRPSLQIAGWPAKDLLKPTPTLRDPGSSESQAALKFRPDVSSPDSGDAGSWELYLDGRLVSRGASGKSISASAKALGPGWHQLLLAGIGTTPIECQREAVGEIEVLAASAGRDQPVRLRVATPQATAGSPVTVAVTAPGAERVVIKQNSRPAGVLEGDSGELKIEADWLGSGPVRLQAFAEPGGAASPPVWLRIE